MEELSARVLALSRTDELTGFQNRRGLAAGGTKLLQIADGQRGEVRVLFVDVGNLQELNEQVGHHAGDAALQAVARALAVTFRKVDVLARIGGTVFLAVALNLDEAECDVMTSRIMELLGAPETTEFVGAPIVVSFGWTTRPADRVSRSTNWWPAPTGPCSRPVTPAGRLSGRHGSGRSDVSGPAAALGRPPAAGLGAFCRRVEPPRDLGPAYS